MYVDWNFVCLIDWLIDWIAWLIVWEGAGEKFTRVNKIKVIVLIKDRICKCWKLFVILTEHVLICRKIIVYLLDSLGNVNWDSVHLGVLCVFVCFCPTEREMIVSLYSVMCGILILGCSKLSYYGAFSHQLYRR